MILFIANPHPGYLDLVNELSQNIQNQGLGKCNSSANHGLKPKLHQTKFTMGSVVIFTK